MSSLSRIFHCLTGVLCLGLVIASPIAAGAATTWTASAPRGVGTMLANAPDLGPLAPDTAVHLVVALALPYQGGPQRMIQEENTPGNLLYGTGITPSQFTATYAPAPAQVQAVTDYLSTAGPTNVRGEANS